MSTWSDQLEAVPDLLAELSRRKPPGQRLLGFAALTGQDNDIVARAQDKCCLKGCDLLMANPIDRPDQGFGASANGGWLVSADGRVIAIPTTSKLALAHDLLNHLQAAMSAGG